MSHVATNPVLRGVIAALVFGAALPASAGPQVHYWPGNGTPDDVAGGAACTFNRASYAEGVTGSSEAGAFDFSNPFTDWWVPPPGGWALVSCDGDAEAGRFGTSDFLISFAVRSRQSSGVVALVSKRDVCGHANFWDIRMVNGVIYPEVDDGNGNFTSFTGTSSVADGKWHTVALVRRNATTTLYVDGAPEFAFTGWPMPGTPADVTTTAPVRIGWNVCGNSPWGGSTYGDPFTGQIDELTISSK